MTMIETTEDKDAAILVKFRLEFDNLQATINGLISQDEDRDETTITGVFASAGRLIEKLLLHIIRKENLQHELDKLDGKHKGIHEYTNILKKILPKQQSIHILNVNQWRNLIVHGNDIDKVHINELNAVNSALSSVASWFFNDYNRNPTEEKSGYSRNFKKRLKFRGIVILGLIIGLTCSYSIYSEMEEMPVEENKLTRVDKEQIYEFLEKYYNSLNDKKSNADQFFAKKIDRFYTKANITPTIVDVIRQTEIDYIDGRHAIDKESLYLHQETDSVSYWRFWNDFTCYRTSKKKFQSCKVYVEFGINPDKKIRSIKEIKYVDLKFTNTRP